MENLMTCRLCGDDMPGAEVLDHLRLLHPDDYEALQADGGIVGVDGDTLPGVP